MERKGVDRGVQAYYCCFYLLKIHETVIQCFPQSMQIIVNYIDRSLYNTIGYIDRTSLYNTTGYIDRTSLHNTTGYIDRTSLSNTTGYIARTSLYNTTRYIDRTSL